MQREQHGAAWEREEIPSHVMVKGEKENRGGKEREREVWREAPAHL